MNFREAYSLAASKTRNDNEAFLLLEKATGLSRMSIMLGKSSARLPKGATPLLKDMIFMLEQNMPIQYILGEWEFMGLKFLVTPDVLIPRWDTEILVENAVKFINAFPPDSTPSVLDLCTGSGCIAVSIAHLCPSVRVTASDIAPNSLEIAKKNAELHNVSERVVFAVSDLFDGITGRFDCITANPPYIPTREIYRLPEEIRDYEPFHALDGGKDGLDFYRSIIPRCAEFLNEGGFVFLEIGYKQCTPVTKILHKSGFMDIKVIKDYSGHDRVISARIQNVQ